VNVQYLHGGARFDDRNVWDFFFSCNVNGSNLIWVVNGIGVGEFLPEQLGTVHMESLSTFNYTSTLLSSRPMTADNQLNSIIVVSVPSNSTMTVECASDTGSDTTNNNRNVVPPPSNGNNSLIKLVQLWGDGIVSDSLRTQCFMCGVSSADQLWETNTNDQFALDTGFQLGSQDNVPSVDNDLLRLQTIYFAVSPLQLVSILLVTDSSFTDVTCSGGGISENSAHLGTTDMDTSVASATSAEGKYQ